MKNLLLLLPLLVMACGQTETTPARQYYALNQLDVGLLESAKIAVDDCMARGVIHPCRKAIPPIQDAVRANKKTFAATDRVFANGDASYYNVALQTAQNAIDSLEGLITIIKTP